MLLALVLIHECVQLSTATAGPAFNTKPKRSGSVGVGILAAIIVAIGFHAYELPWFVGVAVGAALGYWYKVMLKIAIVLVLVGLGIAVVGSFLKG